GPRAHAVDVITPTPFLGAPILLPCLLPIAVSTGSFISHFRQGYRLDENTSTYHGVRPRLRAPGTAAGQPVVQEPPRHRSPARGAGSGRDRGSGKGSTRRHHDELDSSVRGRRDWG